MPHDDPIKPARGGMFGLALGVVLWALVYVLYKLAM